MANKKTKGKKNENLGGLIVVAVILIVLIVVVSLRGNKKNNASDNENDNNGATSSNELYLEEIEIGNTTVVKAKLFLYSSDKVPTIKSGDTINMLTNGQLDFSGTVSIMGDQVKEIKPGSAVAGVLVQLDSLVNLSIGEEVNIIKDDFQIGTLIIEDIM